MSHVAEVPLLSCTLVSLGPLFMFPNVGSSPKFRGIYFMGALYEYLSIYLSIYQSISLSIYIYIYNYSPNNVSTLRCSYGKSEGRCLLNVLIL